MRFELHVYHHVQFENGELGAKIDQVVAGLSTLTEDFNAMGEKTNVAVAALIEEVTDSKGKLASLITTVQGFPAVVAQAVADALAAADVDDETAAGLIQTARQDISDAVDQALAASEPTPENPEPEPEPEPET